MISQWSRTSVAPSTHRQRNLSSSHTALSTSQGPNIAPKFAAVSPRSALRGLAIPAGRSVAVRAQAAVRPVEADNTWPSAPEGLSANLVGNVVRHLKKLPWFNQQDIAKQYDSLRPLWEAYEQQELHIPRYLNQPFHVWLGNDSWASAFNGESVMTMFADINAITKPRTRGASRLDVVNAACAALLPTLGCDADDVRHVVDLGCGTGRPTRLLANRFKHAQVVGIDASSHALAVARLRADALQDELLPEEVVDDRVSFTRALAEKTPFADNSQDVVYMSYVAHELPRYARNNILAEAFRITRPGGVVAIVDHKQEGTAPYRFFNEWKQYKLVGDLAEKMYSAQAPEPWLRAYHRELLTDSFAKHGFEPAQLTHVSKGQHVVFARKPAV